MLDRPSDRSRALSDVIGYILVFSLIFLTITVVSISGLPALDTAKETEQIQNAQRAFDILDNNLEEIYKHGAPSRATEISASSGAVAVREPVTINVSVTEAGSGNVTHTVQEITPIAFTGLGQTEFVYAGGAVFRQRSESSVMLSTPPFNFDDKRGFVTLVRTFSREQRSISGGTVLVRATSSSRSVEVADTALGSSQYEQLTVEIADSPRQDGWQEYLESALPNPNCTTSGGLSCVVDLDGEGVEQLFLTIQSIEVVLEL